jgi:hypothetical protein
MRPIEEYRREFADAPRVSVLLDELLAAYDDAIARIPLPPLERPTSTESDPAVAASAFESLGADICETRRLITECERRIAGMEVAAAEAIRRGDYEDLRDAVLRSKDARMTSEIARTTLRELEGLVDAARQAIGSTPARDRQGSAGHKSDPRPEGTPGVGATARPAS